MLVNRPKNIVVGNIRMNQRGNISRGRTMQSFKSHEIYFKHDTVFNWKPMKVLQQWQRMCAAVSSLNESCGTILDSLEPVDEIGRRSSEKGITVINVAHHIGVHELAGGVLSDEPPDLSDSMEMIE